MDRIHKKFKIVGATLAVSAATILVAQAGTRFIPPPPVAQDGEAMITEDSYFGSTRGRFSALEDDEGREIDVADHLTESDERITSRQYFSRPGQASRGGRSPASLQFNGDSSESAQAQPEIQVKSLNRPALKRKPSQRELSSEIARQEKVTEEFITDLNDPIARRKGVQEVALIASDLGFFPKTFFVSRDVPVRLFVTGSAKGSLCLMMDSFNVRKQIRGGKIEEITFTPNQPGTYRYYCPVNGSEGVMVVKELSTSMTAAMTD